MENAEFRSAWNTFSYATLGEKRTRARQNEWRLFKIECNQFRFFTPTHVFLHHRVTNNTY